MSKTFSPIPSNTLNRLWIILLALYVAGIGTYFILRYGGQWIDIDSARLTNSARAVRDQATIIPSANAYAYGYGYPTTLVWLSLLSGIRIVELQTDVLPLVSVVVSALVALVFFRTLVGTGAGALLATLFLFLQPDFLFVTLRGSHEKMTWPLVMIAVFILIHSTRKSNKIVSLLIHIVLFYLTIYALITTSTFFASSLLTSITLAFLIGAILSRWFKRRGLMTNIEHFQRLAIISMAGMVLLYIFVYYIYTTSIQTLYMLPSIIDKIGTLFLGFSAQTNPYAYIGSGWSYAWVYPLLSAFTWLLLIGSMVEWIYQAYRLLKGAQFSLPEWFLWLFYAGFALQVAAAIVVDFAGVLSSNMQLRLLPGLVIFASALLAKAVFRLIRSLDLRLVRLVVVPFILLIMVFSGASLLKATNEPLVSNQWSFYNASDQSALVWSDTHIQNSTIWVGRDERLLAVSQGLNLQRKESHNILYYTNQYTSQADTIRYYLVSDIERMLRARLGISLPAVDYENQVYDNGDDQVFHLRPRTPYQR